MKIYAISDLHLTGGKDKPMDIFGPNWVDHWEKIKQNWLKLVKNDDCVLIAGDISWGMNIDEVAFDLNEIEKLNGKKILIRGNHDYWWSSLKKLNSLNFNSITFIQNNSLKINDTVFCGTRGWIIPDNNSKAEDLKIFHREILRLQLSLDSAKKESGREIVGLIHYPPFGNNFEATRFTDLFCDYGIKKVVYGHLHAKQAKSMPEIVHIDGVDYVLTSCDYLNFTLKTIF